MTDTQDIITVTMLLNQLIKFIIFLLIATYSLACLFGILNFHLWGQVVTLWDDNTEISSLLLHPHGMRYLLVYPIFVVSDLLNVSYNWLFSNTVIILIITITRHVIKAVEEIQHGLTKSDKDILFLLICSFFMALSLFMNGRILFALTGSAILINILISWDKHNLWGIVLPLFLIVFLSSVSSGTLVVSIITFISFLIYKSMTTGLKYSKNHMLLILFAGILATVFPLLKILVMKNINFYGGGWDGLIAMLAHGLGKVFLVVDSDVLALILLTLALTVMLFLMSYHYYKRMIIPIFFIALSLAGGLFGKSTLMMFLPPFIVVVCVMLFHSNLNKHINV